MTQPVRFVGDKHALQLFGVKLVGVDADNGKKLLFTVALIVLMLLLSKLFRAISHSVKGNERTQFWVRQGIHLFTALVMLIGFVSIWFDNADHLTTAIGLMSAGLAFALQRVITAIAGYFLILRGRTFNVGDRIVMGGVRGDVMALGFLQTTIMEMGQPPPVQNADPAMWVRARQYTGRIVTVSNAQVFDEPVFNYSRDFPYIWEELMLPIAYRDDWEAVEQLLLQIASKHTMKITELGEPALKRLEERYVVSRSEMSPHVFVRLTDNWIELSLRFFAEDHGVRSLKDAMSRDLLAGLKKAGIGIASGTYEIVGMPTLRIERAPSTMPAQPQQQSQPRPKQLDDQP